MFRNLKKRIGSILLIAVMVVGMMQGQFSTVTFAEEKTEPANRTVGGQIVLAASNSSEVVIEPTFVDYYVYENEEDGEIKQVSETIEEFLSRNPKDHTFTAQSGNGFYNCIDGMEGSYNRFDNNGDYDVTKEIAGIKAFFFVGNECLKQENCSAFSDLLTAMATFNATENGVKKYQPAQSAYADGLASFFNKNADYEALTLALTSAMGRYETEVLDAQPAALSIDFTDMDGNSLEQYTFTVKDAYGNEYSFDEDETPALIEGTYSFELSDGSKHKSAGNITVSIDGEGEDTVAYASIDGNRLDSIALYTGEDWLGDILLHPTNLKGKPEDSYRHETVDGKEVYYIPDYEEKTYIYIEKGPGIDETEFNSANVKVWPYYTDTRNKVHNASLKTDYLKLISGEENLVRALQAGSQPNEVLLKAVYEKDGYSIIEERLLDLQRIPSLKNLEAFSNGVSQDIGFQADRTEYSLNVASDTLVIRPTAYGEDYAVSINGELCEEKEFALGEGGLEVEIQVSQGEHSKIYSLTVSKVEAVEASVHFNNGESVQVFTAVGGEIGPKSTTNNTSLFDLIEGQSYYYVNTKNNYYHAKENFTAAPGLAINAKSPKTEDWLESLAMFNAMTAAKSTYVYLGTDFRSNKHEYDITIPDYNTSPRVYAKLSNKASEETSIYVAENQVTIPSDNRLGIFSNLLTTNDIAGTITIRVSEETEGTEYYQDYLCNAKRSTSIQNNGVQVYVDGVQAEIYQVIDDAVTTDGTFKNNVCNYQINVLSNSEAAKFSFVPTVGTYTVLQGENEYGVEDGVITVNLPLDYTKTNEQFSFTVKSEKDNTDHTTYNFQLIKRDPIDTLFTVKDTDGNEIEALVTVFDSISGKRIWPENGSYKLVDSMKYKVVTTCYGYVGNQTEITAGDNNKNIEITMTKASDKVIREDLDSSWPQFRGSEDANGVVNFKTPVEAENTALSWATKLGDGYGSEAVGCPILITENGYEYLIVYSRDVLYKVDALSGEVVAQGQMCTNSNFSINSATYAEGMIFIGLSNGTVQAFDAISLESLWEYHDELGGQPNCPITYWNGYIYTGFWNAETRPANFVCLSVTDEDVSTGHENKMPTWTHQDNGFYWAGAYIDSNGDFLLVPTDDGDGGYLQASAKLLCMNPLTGEIYDALTDIAGDARSNISFDGNGRYYFTSKGGYLYSVRVDVEKEGNKVVSAKITDRKNVYLQNYHDDPSNPPMSTCTPVIYNNRAYIGVSGVGQFTQYSGHNITVVDLNSWRVIYSLPTQGYPQTSGLLTTGYEEDDGNVYVYFFDNMTPGKLRVLVDNSSIVSAEQALRTTHEVFMNSGNQEDYDTPYVLFTPSGEQAQYAICSPIADSHGNIYFKNDSAQLMSLMNTIESMEVVTPPTKTDYDNGEPLDLSGMEIEVTYSNGCKIVLPYSRTYTNGQQTKEILYFTTQKNAVYGEDTIFVAFANAMYQDRNGERGVSYVPQTAQLQINVSENNYIGGETTESDISIHPDAQLEYSVSQGEMLNINLENIFSYNGSGTLSYSCQAAETGLWGSQSKMNGKTLVFTNAQIGEYTGTVYANVGDKTASVDLKITVTEGAAGLDIQYGYDESPADYVTVYVTMSQNGVPLLGNDKDNTPLMHLKVDLPYFDLANYDIADYSRYHADATGSYIDSQVVHRPTAMHLMIYMTIKYFLGIDASDQDIISGKYNPLTADVEDYIADEYMYDIFGNIAYEINKRNGAIEYTGGAQSTYMKQSWGYDENLMYYRNHVYPLQSPGWGSTSDYILLSDGDTFDVSHYSNWDFYHHGAFCTFKDENGKLDIEKDGSIFTATVGEAFNFSTVKFGTQEVSDGGSDYFKEMDGLTVYVLDGNKNVLDTLNPEDGTEDSYSYTFDTAGTYYIMGLDPNAGDEELACFAAATARVDVTEKPGPSGYDVQLVDYTKGAATVSGLTDGEQYLGSTTFTVDSPEACVVLCSKDNGETYERLEATETADSHQFTVDIDSETRIVVALKGDITLDGKVNSTDVKQISRYTTGLRQFESLNLMVGDINKDGKVNSTDGKQISRFVAELRSFSW